MHEFTDAKERKWSLPLNVAVLRRMRLLAGFDLSDVLPKDITTKEAAKKAANAYGEFLNDDERFASVLYAIVKPQADADGVTQEQFEEGLDGEANQRAIIAFHGAFTDFSQNPRKTLLRGMKLGLKRAEKRLAKLDAITDAEIEKAIDEAESKQSAGELPENSPSTPAPVPSVN
jgi:hypothetical protein